MIVSFTLDTGRTLTLETSVVAGERLWVLSWNDGGTLSKLADGWAADDRDAFMRAAEFVSDYIPRQSA